MNILKHKMQRRDFLRTLAKAGATTAFASQFMLSKDVFAATGGAKRFIMVYYPNGCMTNDWHNYNTGGLGASSLDNSTPLKPFARHIDKILPIKNLDLTNSGGNSSHSESTRVFSGGTGGRTFDSSMGESLGGVSFDNLYTSLYARENLGAYYLPFVDKNGARVGDNDDPQKVFDDKLSVAVSTNNEADPEIVLRKRVLESLHENLDLLQNETLNITENSKLLGHEEGLNFYQKILSNNINITDPNSYSRPSVGMPIKQNGAYTNEQVDMGEELAKAQMRNIAMVFQAGMTNTASFQFMSAQSDVFKINFPSIRPYMGDFGSGAKLYYNENTSHNASHNSGTLLTAQTMWYNMMVAYLMDELAQRDDATYGGKILDNTMILMVSETAHGPNHTQNDAGVYLAGGAGGSIRTGNAIDAGGADISDLYMDITRAFGLNWNGYGASNGSRSTGVLI